MVGTCNICCGDNHPGQRECVRLYNADELLDSYRTLLDKLKVKPNTKIICCKDCLDEGGMYEILLPIMKGSGSLPLLAHAIKIRHKKMIGYLRNLISDSCPGCGIYLEGFEEIFDKDKKTLKIFKLYLKRRGLPSTLIKELDHLCPDCFGEEEKELLKGISDEDIPLHINSIISHVGKEALEKRMTT